MTRRIAVVVLLALSGAWVCAQEVKPVPKDSIRISIPGCAKGAVFTVGLRTAEEPGSINLPEGTHMHMNGPKKILSDIKAHEGVRIELSGIVKRMDLQPDAMSVGKGVSISQGVPRSAPTTGGAPVPSQIQIDVEGWRQIPGDCRVR